MRRFLTRHGLSSSYIPFYVFPNPWVSHCSPSVHDLQGFGVGRALYPADRAGRVSSLLFLTGKRGDSAAPNLKLRLSVPNQATATARAPQPELVGRLAKFFPQATPVRIPIKLSRIDGRETVSIEETVIEFGTACEVLFALGSPLEFADRVLLESKDGSLRVEASIVAVQYHPNRTIVAARFLKNVPNWIVKP